MVERYYKSFDISMDDCNIVFNNIQLYFSCVTTVSKLHIIADISLNNPNLH